VFCFLAVLGFKIKALCLAVALPLEPLTTSFLRDVQRVGVTEGRPHFQLLEEIKGVFVNFGGLLDMMFRWGEL
jgi:hypothetical protein